MAVTLTQVRKRPTDSAEIGPSGESETQYFQVTVSQNATPLEIERASGSAPTGDGGTETYPAYGAAHSIDTSLVVIAKSAKRESVQGANGVAPIKTWIVEVKFGRLGTVPISNTGNSKNITIEVSGAEESVYTQESQDTAHTPIRNAVGDLYPDPIQTCLYDEVIKIDYETSSVNGGLIASLRGKINDNAITMSLPQGLLTFSRTFAKHCVLLKEVSYRVTFSKSDATLHVWAVSVLLLIRDDTWDKLLPQKGYRWKADNFGDGTLTEWKDHPEYLDADGFKLQDGDPIVTTDPIQDHKEADLGAFLGGI